MKATNKTMKPRTILTALGLATLLAGTAHANQEQPAASMNETRLEAGRTRDQSTATLVTLTVLTKQEKGDLRPAYQVFTAQIPKIEMASASTRTRASFMLGGHKSALRCISSQPQ